MALKTPEPHRFTDLTINEVSLVDNPAILSADETTQGVGFPVVKGEEPSPPEWVTKSLALKDDEDYISALQRLVQTCKINAQVNFPESDVYYMSASTIKSDYVDFAESWLSPMDAKYRVYRCSYTQEDGGEFKISKVERLRVEIKYISDMEQVAQEEAPANAEMQAPDAPAEVTAPAEKTEVAMSVEVPAATVAAPTPEVTAPVATEAPVEKAARVDTQTKGLNALFDVNTLLELQKSTGIPYRLVINADGSGSMEPVIVAQAPIEAAVVAAKAEVAKAEVAKVEAPKTEVAKAVEPAKVEDPELVAARAEIMALKQQLAGSATNDALVAKAVSTSDTNHKPADLLNSRANGLFASTVFSNRAGVR